MEIIDQLHKLLAEKKPDAFSVRRWLKNKKVEVYVRITQRYVDDTFVESIDIANIDIKKERNQGKGWFTGFITQVEELAATSSRCVYIESIVSERFANFIIKRGYLRSMTSYNSFYKLNQTPQ
jgi:hypothetical protein